MDRPAGKWFEKVWQIFLGFPMREGSVLLAQFALGAIFLAAILFVPVFVPSPYGTWDTMFENWLPAIFGFVGTILGAAIGALATLSAERRKRLLFEKTQFYIALSKVQEMFSDFSQINSWITEAEAKIKPNGFSSLWQVVEPLAGAPKGSAINPECLAVFLEAREYDLAHELGQIVRQHSSMCEFVDTYNRLRTELRNVMKVVPNSSTSKEPGKFESRLTSEELAVVAPRLTELESLLQGMKLLLPDYCNSSKKILTAFKPAAERHFGPINFPNVSFK